MCTIRGDSIHIVYKMSQDSFIPASQYTGDLNRSPVSVLQRLRSNAEAAEEAARLEEASAAENGEGANMPTDEAASAERVRQSHSLPRF